MANKITTVFDADTKGLSTGLKKIKSDIKEADGALGKMRAGIKSSVDSFKKSNTQQAAAIAGLGAAAFKAVGLASDLEESVNAVTVTYGENADAVLKLGENSAEAFGLSKSEFNSLAVSFAAFAETAAGPGGDVAATLQEMTTRVADFASVMNLDLATATQVFQSSLAGQTEPIRKYGKDLSAAAVEQFALANGLIETKSELTETIKVQARYGLLMEQTADTAGDFANTSDSLANSQRILKAEATDLAAGIGEDLLPAMTALVTGMRSLVTVTEALQLDEVLGFLDDIGPAAEDFGQSLRGAFDKGAKANFEMAKEFERTEMVVAEFDRTLLDNATTFDEARQAVLDNTEGMDGWVDTAHIANVVALEWNETNEASKRAMEDARKEAAKLRGEEENLRRTTEYLGGSLADTTDDLSDAEDATEDLTEATKEQISATDNLTNAFMGLRDEIADRNAYLDLEAQFAELREEGGLTETSLNDLRLKVVDYAEEIDTLPASVFTEILAMIDEGAYAEAEARLASIERARIVNVRVVQAGGVFTPNIAAAPTSSGDARYFGATGGVVNRPTSGITLGESGPEAVIPLERSPGNSPLPSGLGGGLGGGGMTINMTVNAGMGADGAQVGKQIVDVIKRYERVNGTRWRS